MDILQKLRETAFSVIPIICIVVLLGLTAVPLETDLILRFIAGGILLIVGLTVFLLGVDTGILSIGERCGAELTKRRNLPLLLGASFVIGFFVTAAEPDIQVLADQVRGIFPLVSKQLFIVMIATGVGFFIMLGLLRTVLHLSLKIILAVSYGIIFFLAFTGPQNFIGISFDAGGATTGPMTVPFIMALGLGVSAVRTKPGNSSEDPQSDSFGLTGMASAGPIMAVLVYGILLSGHAGTGTEAFVAGTGSAAAQGISAFVGVFPSVAKEAALSLMPVVLLFIFFQLALLHMPPHQIIRIVIGLVYSYIGLVIFLVGVNGGFMAAGYRLGELLGLLAAGSGRWWNVLLVGTGLLIGAVVVCAEPAVWVLTDQVESISGGTIKRKVLLVFLSAGVAVSVGLAMIRAVEGFSLMYLLVPGYAVSLLLLPFCPKLFTGIAFDSGGVASGPICSTFVLSFTLGASRAAGSSTDVFGVIALVAMMPLIAIQILGLEYSRKRKNI